MVADSANGLLKGDKSNMIYAMSDIHGMYDKFKQMLEKINFSDEDTLYILGDIVDRGPNPIAVLKDIMDRQNVYPVMGNHDLLALDILKKLCVDIEADNIENQLNAVLFEEINEWYLNGGQTTNNDFLKLTKEERADILDYISSFPLCEIAETNEKTFILVHAGLGNFRKGKKLREYTAEELLETRSNYNVKYFDDDNIFVVSGHTPTLAITGKAEIYHKCNNIAIDCGANFEKGRLACICLDNLNEFYV